MKKAVFFSLLLIFLAIAVVSGTTRPVNSPDSHPARTIESTTAAPTPVLPVSAPAPVDRDTGPAADPPLRSEVPIPSPSTLLLIGSGLIGLIIYRHKFKDQK